MNKAWKVNERVFSFLTTADCHVEGVIQKDLHDGWYHVVFGNRIMQIHGDNLYSFDGVDEDLRGLNWQQLQEQVMRWRAGARYVLSQREDDLCWRDFYTHLAALLPEKTSIEELTTPPTPVFHNNCLRFERCMRDGTTYCTDHQTHERVKAV